MNLTEELGKLSKRDLVTFIAGALLPKLFPLGAEELAMEVSYYGAARRMEIADEKLGWLTKQMEDADDGRRVLLSSQWDRAYKGFKEARTAWNEKSAEIDAYFDARRKEA